MIYLMEDSDSAAHSSGFAVELIQDGRIVISLGNCCPLRASHSRGGWLTGCDPPLGTRSPEQTASQ